METPEAIPLAPVVETTPTTTPAAAPTTTSPTSPAVVVATAATTEENNNNSEATSTDGQVTSPTGNPSTTATESSTTAAPSDAPRTATVLLREWQYPPVAVAPAVAVVAEEEGSAASPTNPTTAASDSSGIPPSLYPVATFVRDFVRTSISHVSDHVSDLSNTVTANVLPTMAMIRNNHYPGYHHTRSDSDQDVLPLSVRSEADAQAISALMDNLQQPSPASGQPQSSSVLVADPQTTVSARTVDDWEDEEAEFILVDGDLIALSAPQASRLNQRVNSDEYYTSWPPHPQAYGGHPQHPPHSQSLNPNYNNVHEVPSQAQQQQQQPRRGLGAFFQDAAAAAASSNNRLNQQKACRPSRTRRVVRKLQKMLGRKKKRSTSTEGNLESSLVDDEQSIQTAPTTSAAVAATTPGTAASNTIEPVVSAIPEQLLVPRAGPLGRQSSMGESSAASASSPGRGRRRSYRNSAQLQQIPSILNIAPAAAPAPPSQGAPGNAVDGVNNPTTNNNTKPSGAKGSGLRRSWKLPRRDANNNNNNTTTLGSRVSTSPLSEGAHEGLTPQLPAAPRLDVLQTTPMPPPPPPMADSQQPRRGRGRLSPAASGLIAESEMVATTPRDPLRSSRAGLVSTPPPMPLIPEASGSTNARTSSSRTQSVTASFIGTADQVGVVEGGTAIAEAFVAEDVDEYLEQEAKKLAMGEIPASLVPADADYKVDKSDGPDVESMLLRAAHETANDLQDPGMELSAGAAAAAAAAAPVGKRSSGGVPLSEAKSMDRHVYNDILKVVLVGSSGVDKSSLGRTIRESRKRPRKRMTLGLDVHTWTASDVHFQIWDVQGSSMHRGSSHHNNSNSGTSSSSQQQPSNTQGTTQQQLATLHDPNFGAHPGTQSLFFSAESLYLLVWDLGVLNPHTHLEVEDADSDDEDGNLNEYAREEAYKQADRALAEDINNRVLSWVDRIAERAPKSAILPVAVLPDDMTSQESARRCQKMFEMLEMHMKWYEDNEKTMPNIVLDDSRNILCVNYTDGTGIQQIRDTMVAIATDSSRSVFEHVGTPVPPGVVEILEFVRTVKHDHKLIRIDHIFGELGDSIPMPQVVQALHFLSNVGELLYFGTTDDDVLSGFVVLSRKWLVSALSCILRNDLKRELADLRKFMNMQCIYSEQKFQENEVLRVLSSGPASSCPLLSDEDAIMLWRSMSFMREAADSYSNLNETSTSAPTLFCFLERLLVRFGIFLPLGMSSPGCAAAAVLDRPSEIMFVPSLLSQAHPGDIWGYRCSDSWTTTLCHTWLFRDGAPADLFENLVVSILRDLYYFAHQFKEATRREAPHRSHTVPLGRASRHEFMEEHDGDQAIGPVRIHQINCWKSAMLLKIGTVFPDREAEELRESIVEVFVTIVDQNSSHCVASDAMRGCMQRVVVSGKGQSGHNGLKLFKGGYQAVLDSVSASLANFNNVNMQVVCPECLARGHPRRASTWGWDDVLCTAEERREATIVCRRGHRVKSNLLCGTCKEEPLAPAVEPGSAKPVTEILPSVVLIGLYDPHKKQMRSVGSGFVADKKHGLILTAGHVLFNMEEGRHYGTPYLGVSDAKVVIGVIPQEDEDKNNAVWRYFADIVADDVRNNVDACVLRITTRMENDVDDEDPACGEQPEVPLDIMGIKDENLSRLRLETNFDLEESVRILGYNQGGEGLLVPGQRLLRSADFAKGYICRVFSANMSDDSSSSSDSESRHTFSPREEIVVMCPTISGHSGGPCVNDDGQVVGILSRADPADRNRCYLVPASHLKSLVKRAKNECSRPVYPTLRNPSSAAVSRASGAGGSAHLNRKSTF